MANPFKNDVYRSGKMLGVATTIILIAWTGLAVIAMLGSVFVIVASGDVEFGMRDVGWVIIGLAGLVQLGVRILSGVLFLVWLHRVYNNLPVIGARNLEFSPGWAVGWWFIPFANFVQPYKIVKELYRESQRHAAAEVAPVSTETVSMWWGAFLISLLAMRVSDAMLGKSGESLPYFPIAHMIAQLLSAGAAVYAIVIIKDVNNWQDKASKALAAAGSDLPPPPPVFDHGD